MAQPVEVAAELLSRGKIVGWHQGRMEFGPRALGNRSILADPRERRMKDHINARVKFREPFRPFAPAITAEAVGDYFDCQHPVPHMTHVLTVRPSMRDRIAATVHDDGSARVQTCSKQDNPLFHSLLQAFARRTGVPVLLNTSLNVNGMPIAAWPEQSVSCLLESELDFLFLGELLLWKDARLTELVRQATSVGAGSRQS